MGTQQSSGYCHHCQQQVSISRPTPNHILHLLLTICTGGLWIIVWILLSLRPQAWRCNNCGKTVRTGLAAALTPKPRQPQEPQQAQEPQQTLCPYCRESVHPHAEICKHCQKPLQGDDVPVICPQCNRSVSPTEKNCPHCGFVNPALRISCSECGTDISHRPDSCPECGKRYTYSGITG